MNSKPCYHYFISASARGENNNWRAKMAIYKTDHRRNVDGDNINLRASEFTELGDIVAGSLASFSRVHEDMKAATVLRMHSENDIEDLRRKRDALTVDLVSLYAWGYYNAVWPSYEDWEGGELPGAVIRASLYPGGSPSRAGRSRQWLKSAVSMSIEAIKAGKARNLPASCMPAQYVSDLIATYEAYLGSIAAVTASQTVLEKAIAKVTEARAAWDLAYKVLVSNTKFALTAMGESDRLSKLIPVASEGPGTAGILEPREDAPPIKPPTQPLEVIDFLPPIEDDVAA